MFYLVGRILFTITKGANSTVGREETRNAPTGTTKYNTCKYILDSSISLEDHVCTLRYPPWRILEKTDFETRPACGPMRLAAWRSRGLRGIPGMQSSGGFRGPPCAARGVPISWGFVDGIRVAFAGSSVRFRTVQSRTLNR